MPDWTIIIPVKGGPTAKSRLGASRQLALAIALDTVAAAGDVADVLVVTSAEIGQRFEALGVRVVLDEDGGLNAAVTQGIAAVTGATAVLLGDVPAVRPAELAAALELAERYPRAFVSDADNDGTVLITALNPEAHRPAFGAHSRVAHLAAGYVELDIPIDSGLRRDVDTVQHLAELAERVGPRTADLTRTGEG